MSNVWINIRFKDFFLQIGSPKWYSIKISKNFYHKENDYPDGIFSIYDFFFW